MSGMAKAYVGRFIEGRKITATAALVLNTLADFHNQDTGRCNPSIATIARKTARSVRGVQGALAQLKDMGILKSKQIGSKSEGGKWRNHSNHYTFVGLGKSKHVPSSMSDIVNLVDYRNEAVATPSKQLIAPPANPAYPPPQILRTNLQEATVTPDASDQVSDQPTNEWLDAMSELDYRQQPLDDRDEPSEDLFQEIDRQGGVAS